MFRFFQQLENFAYVEYVTVTVPNYSTIFNCFFNVSSPKKPLVLGIVRRRHPDSQRRVHGLEWPLQQPVRSEEQTVLRPAVHDRNRLHRGFFLLVVLGSSSGQQQIGRFGTGFGWKGKVATPRATGAARSHANDLQRSAVLRPTPAPGPAAQGGKNRVPAGAERGHVSISRGNVWVRVVMM